MSLIRSMSAVFWYRLLGCAGLDNRQFCECFPWSFSAAICWWRKTFTFVGITWGIFLPETAHPRSISKFLQTGKIFLFFLRSSAPMVWKYSRFIISFEHRTLPEMQVRFWFKNYLDRNHTRALVCGRWLVISGLDFTSLFQY